ncbi:LuxR C-terminal-related transcriptional regulator [Microvirga yunnanensis]|uniref:LuxR C-terminal-related transcriptional regulator n=2 Tax=Microvirga TaxID=186650 RepID=UPI0021CA3DD1|nr:response regulator transcription factor [Microvirga sp. HBU65207]
MTTLTLADDRSSSTTTSSNTHTASIPTVLIGDSLIVRSGLRHILRDTPFDLATAQSETKLLQSGNFEPALILIDAHQTTGRMLGTIRQMRERFPQARIVALADRFDLGFVRSGDEAGLNGFCSPAGAPDVLIKSLELVMLGETVLPFEALRPVMGSAPQAPEQSLHGCTAEPNSSDLKACKLSVREREILACLTQGEPNKVIARKLDITEATIKVHVKAILRKIGASNRTQAALWASQRLIPRGGASVNG